MSENDRTTRQFLQMLASAGVSHLPAVTLPAPKATPAAKRTRQNIGASAAPQPKPAVPRAAATSLRPGTAIAPPVLKETESLLASVFETSEQKGHALSQLAEIVAGCQRCTDLADSRRQTVFGVGNPNADIMFVGEAPGADEDRQGEPFVGAAGQLLDKIITACGLKREEIYICNILRCRPPGNRNPKPQEAANCREFLDGQIKIINPRYIVCWGTVAAQNLLGETSSVGRLRGRFLQHGDAKVICTYHPSYLLRTPSAKKLVWEDMKLFMKELGVDLN